MLEGAQPLTVMSMQMFCHHMQVLRGHLRRSCDQCGGALGNTQSPAELRDTLAVLRNVARYHCFALLQDLTDWLLQGPAGHVT